MSATVSLEYGKLRLSNHFTEDKIGLASLPSGNFDKFKILGKADGAQEECKSGFRLSSREAHSKRNI
ncbi:uncharacterized protein RSE6_00644 [Rhynchosporium secalis]|uniref:Uncharacterized protein n=1 Tax=Rhynchosporium secalis TaxID=38038 RepID=A0A1E1LVS2_RHYSE|nr:uncharacterized protein RSE6_00644 [Rhynchosporium secalis]